MSKILDNEDLRPDDRFITNFEANNTLYLYGDVDASLPKNFIYPLHKLIKERIRDNDTKPIDIHICSSGGDVDYCFDIISLIEYAKDNDVPIHTYTLSAGSSAAAMISITGSKRFISPRSILMFHYQRGFDYGHNPIMVDRNNTWNKHISSNLEALIQKYSNMPLADIQQKLLPDNWVITGSDILQYGLADEMLVK